MQAIVHPLAPVEHEGGRSTHDGKEVRFYKVFAVSDSNWPMYDLEWVSRRFWSSAPARAPAAAAAAAALAFVFVLPAAR